MRKRRSLSRNLTAVLDLLGPAFGFDFRFYSRNVLLKGVEQRYKATGCTDSASYLRLLRETPAELTALFEAVTITVSAFFRDPLVFELLRRIVLPDLMERKAAAGESSLRVWSAGCATGEEPYTVAVLFAETAKRIGTNMDLTLFASDINAGALAKAKRALYSDEAVQNVPHGLLEKYFKREGDLFRFDPALAETVRFSVFDLLDPHHSAPPESVYGAFDLVLCRNVLIYLDPEGQGVVAAKLVKATAKGGCLVLGGADGPPPLLPHLRRITKYAHVYFKKSAPFKVEEAAAVQDPGKTSRRKL